MKDEFINDIILSMSTELSNEALRTLKNVLSGKLYNKEVIDYCTDLVKVDEQKWKRQFELWIACKRLKCCSDATISNYRIN